MTIRIRSKRSLNWLFFSRFLAHPTRLGAVIASSETLGRLIAEQVCRVDGEFVVELGAGTGAVTRAILSSEVPADKLIVVEIDKQMAQYLRSAHPDVLVVEGCAFDILESLPPSVIGRVCAVVCGLPVTLLPLEQQQELAAVMLSLMPEGHCFLVFSYRLTSPLPTRKIGLVGKRLAFTLRNFPPASVWAYGPNGKCPDAGSSG